MQLDYLGHVSLFYEETLWIVANFRTNQKVLATHVGYWEKNTPHDYEAQTNMNRIQAKRVAIQSGARAYWTLVAAWAVVHFGFSKL